ncbi:hypothetical protein AAG906_040233 [Vitis piasezkii]
MASFVAPSLQVSSSPCSWRTRPSPCTRCHLSPSSSSKPLLGSHDYSLLKSLTLSPHVVNSEADSSTRRMKEVKERTREAFYRAWDSRAAMEMVDTVERLGLSYHFEGEINALLQRFCDWNASEDLFTTALRFRLLRQNGFPTPSDVFGKFMDKNGKFKESLTEDIWGMLSLHEASHLGAKNEEVLAEAKEFTRIHLIQSMPHMEPHFSSHVGRALELPRHLRMQPELSSSRASKIDFDMVQSLHQKELTEICFLWTVGIFPDPRHSSCRIELNKAIAILLVIDDIYDSYGSLDELALFTDAMGSWCNGSAPEYMKICYMALYNTTNDIAYRILKEHGWSVIEDLKRTWMDIFGAFLAEAQCFEGGHVPSLEEYLTNAVTTGGTYMALVHAFFLMGQGVTRENMAMLKPYPNIFFCSGKFFGYGMTWELQEGDNASSIECYKREREMDTVLEDEACRKHIRQMIQSLWVELNGELVASSALPLSIIKAAFNLSRTAQVIYQHGDDNKTSSVEDHVQALLFRPVSSNGHAQITMQ